MSSRESRLVDVLRRLIECLDSAAIRFDHLQGDHALEAALEFDEAYIAACEELGIRPGEVTHGTARNEKPPSA